MGIFQLISIHALREESDLVLPFSALMMFQFQSTLSARRATRYAMIRSSFGVISIHALREESDLMDFID